MCFGASIARVSDVRRVVVMVARWSILAVGVFVTTFSLVRMVEGEKTPWWWTGLIGIAATLLGLGAPWSTPRQSSES
jgi:hypothetical protein